MSDRKCIFTNVSSNAKRSIIPKNRVEEEIHNWTLYSPTNLEYGKENRMPTDIEMDIHETFYTLELARLRVKYLENKLKDLQEKNNATSVKKTEPALQGKQQKKKRKTKKEKEIEMAIHEKEVIQEADVDKVLEKRKSKSDLWD